MCPSDILPTLLKLKSKGIMWYLVAWQSLIGSLTQREEANNKIWFIANFFFLRSSLWVNPSHDGLYVPFIKII